MAGQLEYQVASVGMTMLRNAGVNHANWLRGVAPASAGYESQTTQKQPSEAFFSFRKER